ncbi:MFS transporter [Nocardia australiensis]|uniref:MFS transporter n=1 Tax=Nocardia australiensis TaxID=2887191 RepID=UPI001D13D9DF|nr:MFS transporter [Nocardia australiensis]
MRRVLPHRRVGRQHDTYLAELLPRRGRGRYIAWSYTLGFTAVPIAGILAKLANGPLFGIAGWRWLLVFAGVGAITLWLLRRRLPESPRWLAATGRTADATAALARIEREIGSAPVESTALEPDKAPPVARSDDR